MKQILSLCLVMTMLACAGGGDTGTQGDDSPAEGTAPAAAISDTEIGLDRGSVFDVATPDPVALNTSMPGEAPVRPRPYELSPPVIPHTVADFLPINMESNYCIVCHAVAEKVEGEPTPIPESHFVDLRNAPGKVGEQVAGARYNCTACHARATAALPLVANEFEKR